MIYLQLIFVRAFVYFSNFRKIHKLLKYVSKKRASNLNENNLEQMMQISKLIKKCADKLKIRNCLSISLLIFLHLKKKGFNSNFNIGVRKNNTKLESHSWVSFNDEPLLFESELNEYVLIEKI